MRWLALSLVFLMPSFGYAECNFRTSDYAKEMMSPDAIKSINIEVPKSSKFVRNQFKIFTLNSNNIPSKLRKKFKANITVNYDFGICRYIGKIRQNGDLKDHIKFVNWNLIQSIDVQLKTGNILNAVRFKLLIPETRNGLNEVFATTLLRSLDFLAPETFEVNTSVNGVKTVMLFQERAEKELLERNLRREGPIFRGDEVLMWSYEDYNNIELDRLSLSTLYNKRWFKKGSSSQKIVLSAYEKLQNSSLKTRYYQKDVGHQSYLVPDTASETLYNDFMGVLIAMDGHHALYLNNRKHYYNAISGVFEPIYYDGNIDLTRDWKVPDSSLTMAKPVMISDRLFKKVEDLDGNGKLKDEYFKRVINHDEASVFFKDSLANLKSNLRKIQLQAGTIEDLRESLAIVSDSEYYSWYTDFQNSKLLSQKLITKIRPEGNSYLATFDDQSTVALSEDEVLNIIAENKLHDQRVVYIPPVISINKTNEYGIKDISVSGIKIRMSKGMTAKYNLAEKQLEFHQTKPSDWALIHDSYINEWAISLIGLVSSNATPVLEQRFNDQGLTGCLTIYNSELINSSLLVTNGQCEDSLNLVRTSGREISIKIDDAFADAVDADFSFLDIDLLHILNAGNDCFDVSGGKYFVEVSDLKHCGDKGVSVGEKSDFEGNEISLENALIGISAKDFSRAVVKQLNSKNVSICGESKRKKQEFGGGQLFIQETNCNGSYSIDNESMVQIGDL